MTGWTPRTSSGTRCCRSSRSREVVPPPRPAQPPQAPGRRRAGRLHRFAEPHRARLQQAQEPRGRPRVGRADGPPRGSGRGHAGGGLRPGLVHRDRARPSGSTLGRAPAESGAGALRDVTCQLVPSGPGFVAENNLRLFTTLIYSAQRADLADQPVLRARRVAALRRHDRRPARRRRRAVRQRAVRPVHGRPRPGVVLPGAARGGREDLPLPVAVDPALQALHDRRRRGGARVEQHGHAVLRAQLRDLA